MSYGIAGWDMDLVAPAEVVLEICKADNFSLACRLVARSDGASASQYFETTPVGSTTVSYVQSVFVFFFAFSVNVFLWRVVTIGVSSSDELRQGIMSSTAIKRDNLCFSA